MRRILCYGIIFLVLHEVLCISDDIEKGKNALEKLKDGIMGLKNNKILTNVLAAAQVVGYTAVAVKSIIDLVQSFVMGAQDSKELKYMKKQFSIVNGKLDALELEFTDVKNEIDWKSVKLNVGEQERNIKALMDLYKIYLNTPPNATQAFKFLFLESYEHNYSDAALKLYQMLIADGLFEENIISVARRQMKEWHSKISNLVSYVLFLIQQGITLENAYYTMRQDTKSFDISKTEWANRFKQLEPVAAKFDTEIHAAWSTQYKKDSREISLKNAQKTNKELVQIVYNFLKMKYPFRYWYVHAYTNTDAKTDRDRYYQNCHGWSDENIGTKAVNVFSLSPKEAKSPKTNRDIAKNLIQNFGPSATVAKMMFEVNRYSCKSYHFKGVFLSKSAPAFQYDFRTLFSHSIHQRIQANIFLVQVWYDQMIFV